jgi:hypothetical protein
LRKFIFLSSGILFLAIAALLVLIGSWERDNMLIMLSAAAVPFLFTAYWNFYSVYYEGRINTASGHFSYKGIGTVGFGAFYNKVIAVPFFLVLFGSVALAITAAFLASNRSTEDVSFAVLALSFLYSLTLSIYFTIKIGRGIRSGDTAKVENTSDDAGFKIAFFFASVATLGLFPLVYFIIKAVRKK